MEGARVDDGYVWFEQCRVFSENMRLLCTIGGRTITLPVAILHPKCTLREPGDTGRLGVPREWAQQNRLC